MYMYMCAVVYVLVSHAGLEVFPMRPVPLAYLTHSLTVMVTFVFQYGWSPLMIASEKGHDKVVKSLIEAGANIKRTKQVGKYN